MNCECPKCSSNIEIPEPKLPEKGEFAKCGECNGRFWVQKESYILKSLKKEGKVYCFSCGNDQGTDIFCQSCFALFQDYWLIQVNKPKRLKAKKVKGSNSFLPHIHKKRKEVKHKKVIIDTESSKQAKSKVLSAVSIISLLIIAGVIGGVMYLNYITKKEFSVNYVKTLYVIQTGIDYGQNALNQTISSGTKISDTDLGKLKKASGQIDRFFSMLEDPPSDFAKATSDLKEYHKSFLALNRMANGETGRGNELPDRLSSLNNSILETKSRIKQDIPDLIIGDISSNSLKYQNLSYFIN